MSPEERLRKYGVAILAPRISKLGYDPCGGSEVVLWEDVRILQEAGIPVRVYGRAARLGAPVRLLRTRTRAPLLTSLEYCGQFVLRERHALLIAYNEPAVAGFAPERTIVRFDWSTPLPRYWRLPGWCQRFSRATYLFPSQSERDLFLARHSRIPSGSTVVVPNAVDLRLFSPNSAMNSSTLRVGYAGSWASRKGIAVLIEAWERVQAQLPEAELWFAGGAHLWKNVGDIALDTAKLADRLQSLRLRSHFVFRGEIPRKRMPEFWHAVSVAAVPSLYEPFGLVALEAMACGRPVVASRVGGLQEIVIHGETGLLVPPGDPDALAEALMTLLKDAALREHMGRAARLRAEGFSFERRAKGLLGLMRRVSASRTKTRVP